MPASQTSGEAGKQRAVLTGTPRQVTIGLPILGSVDAVFKALADPTRRILIDELAARDGQTLFELCVRLTAAHDIDVSRQAVAKHLAVLEEAGLVHVRREGRYRLHTLDRAPLRAVWNDWFRTHLDTQE